MSDVVLSESIDSQKSAYKNIIEQCLLEAKKQGATDAEISAGLETGLSVNVRMRDVEKVEYVKERGLAVTVFFGQNKGNASTNDFSPEAITKTIEAACRIAKYTDADPCSGLADPELFDKNIPELSLYYPWDINADKAIKLATECESIALSQSDKITNSEGAWVGSGEHVIAYGNSRGVVHSYATTRHSMGCSLIASNSARDDRTKQRVGGATKGGDSPSPSGDMQRDYEYSSSRDSLDLWTPEFIAQSAAKKTIARLDSRTLPTQKAPVIFNAQQAKQLFGCFISAISGGSLYRKASFLVDHLGRQIFPDFINIFEDPFMPKALGSCAIDGDGLKTRQNNFVAGGKLESYVLGVYSARQLGMQSTANASGVHNLQINPNISGFDNLLENMGTGLLVTETIGNGINLMTGDFSQGACGFWVEGGKIQFPVHEVTIAGNLRDMFMGIEAVCDDIDIRGNVRSGSILVNQMTIAGGQ